VQVRVDVSGGSTIRSRWALENSSGTQNCYAYFTPSQSFQTWTCSYVPAGTWRVIMTKPAGATAWADQIW
jgi:hypothetical protein